MGKERVVLDTNVLIRDGLGRLSAADFLSAVVLQEITAGARDGSGVRSFGELGKKYDRAGRLLTPNGEDWYEAGKILNSLYRGLPSRRSAEPVTIPKEEQQRLLRDVLIARSAKRVNAAVMTYNRGDFEKIRRFCDVRVLDPAEYV
jgi:predicted nucleic acid-binding protein